MAGHTRIGEGLSSLALALFTHAAFEPEALGFLLGTSIRAGDVRILTGFSNPFGYGCRSADGDVRRAVDMMIAHSGRGALVDDLPGAMLVLAGGYVVSPGMRVDGARRRGEMAVGESRVAVFSRSGRCAIYSAAAGKRLNARPVLELSGRVRDGNAIPREVDAAADVMVLGQMAVEREDARRKGVAADNADDSSLRQVPALVRAVVIGYRDHHMVILHDEGGPRERKHEDHAPVVAACQCGWVADELRPLRSTPGSQRREATGRHAIAGT